MSAPRPNRGTALIVVAVIGTWLYMHDADHRAEFGQAAELEAAQQDAAPDLLAALQRIVAALDKQVASPHLAERASPLAQAKAAIAKATGEPQ